MTDIPTIEAELVEFIADKNNILTDAMAAIDAANSASSAAADALNAAVILRDAVLSEITRATAALSALREGETPPPEPPPTITAPSGISTQQGISCNGGTPTVRPADQSFNVEPGCVLSVASPMVLDQPGDPVAEHSYEWFSQSPVSPGVWAEPVSIGFGDTCRAMTDADLGAIISNRAVARNQAGSVTNLVVLLPVQSAV